MNLFLSAWRRKKRHGYSQHRSPPRLENGSSGWQRDHNQSEGKGGGKGMSMANLPPHGSPTAESEVGRRSRNHNRSEGRGDSKGKGIGHLPPPGPSASSGTSAAEGVGLGCIMAGSPAAGLSYANIGLSAHLSAKMVWGRGRGGATQETWLSPLENATTCWSSYLPRLRATDTQQRSSCASA